MHIEIYPSRQQLELFQGTAVVARYPVSTAKNGLGEENGSGKTPRGLHQVRAKIGANVPINTVFVGRRPTGESYCPHLAAVHPDRDWILSRILWLSGLEAGFNRFGKVDSQRRYIYIHGTPDEIPFDTPQSHGCIRMKNQDVIRLFEQVTLGCRVMIHHA